MIKHIVISGGDITFLSMVGAINILIDKDFIDLTKIENIYSVSCGCWIGLFMQLKMDMEIIQNYFIERPWEKLMKIDSSDILNLYASLGLFDLNIFYEIFKPLLKMCNLNVDITMIELYEYSKIEFNMYATKFSDLSLECFNHIKTPNIKVIDALFMSSSIPIICRPIKYENNYYIDGGFSCNYPMSFCLEKHKNISEIFGINTCTRGEPFNQSDSENFLSFYTKVFYKLIINIRKKHKSDVNVNTLIIPAEYLCVEKFTNVITKDTARMEMINFGKETAVKFLANASTLL